MAKLQKQKIPFTQVANEVLNDKKLSFKAKGIFAYLFSKPEEWEFSADRIKLDSKDDGRKSVLNGLKELEDLGYLLRKRLSNGKVEYYLKYSLKDENPESPKGTLGTKAQVPLRHSAITDPISNKDILIIKNNTAEQSSANTKVPELIKGFEIINPACKRYYGNKTQRKACEDLISTYGFERVEKVVSQALPKTNELDFFPTITTPLQLFEKWSALEAAIKKHNNKKHTETKKAGAIW